MHSPHRNRHLRVLADDKGIEVHGFLWVIDELYRCDIGAADVLCSALRLLADDPAVRLPQRELIVIYKAVWCSLIGSPTCPRIRTLPLWREEPWYVIQMGV